MATLVLNADYVPLGVVSTKRAVMLVIGEKVEVLAVSGQTWRSERAAIEVPVVVRLLHWVRLPFRRRLPVTRRNVMHRDGGRCGYCLSPASTVDHIRPRSKGGKHRWENVIAACGPCNAEKDNRQLSEILGTPIRHTRSMEWALRIKPTVPEGDVWLAVGITAAEPAWRDYLPATA